MQKLDAMQASAHDVIRKFPTMRYIVHEGRGLRLRSSIWAENTLSKYQEGVTVSIVHISNIDQRLVYYDRNFHMFNKLLTCRVSPYAVDWLLLFIGVCLSGRRCTDRKQSDQKLPRLGWRVDMCRLIVYEN